MSKRKTKSEDPSKRPDETASESELPDSNDFPVWSKPAQRLASLLIVVYLAIVLLGPLSNPIASRYFSAPLAEQVGPIHRMLFLGHGYRFFAPDPGPSHRLLYRGTRKDGSEFSGHFPDRKSNWPRLLYHRWFMLSETMFSEQNLRPSSIQFQQRKTEYERQILLLRTEGKLEMLEQLKNEREMETAFFATTTERVDLLASTVARILMQRNDGQTIELFVQERKIPFPEEVADGLRLDDPALLTESVKIGELDANGFRPTELVEELPAQEGPQ